MRFIAPLASISAASALVISHDIPAILREAESFVEDVQSDFSSVVDGAAEIIHNVKEHVAADFDKLLAQASNLEDEAASFGHGVTPKEIDLSNFTIYQIIAESNYTTQFASYLKEHKDVVDILNKTDSSHTLFVPTDEAFKHLPEHEKLSDEYVDQGLRYHIGLGDQHTGMLFPTHTLPTALNEKFLGGNPQRLRLSSGLRGIFVNEYSKVVAANFKTKNGYIHAVNKIIVQPFMIGRTISLFPDKFSTLLLAYDKTDFVKYVHALPLQGSTVFVPSNKAWEKLGPRANAFLFNTEEGKKHLTALLKYQITPNVTLYSDEVYYGNERASIAELSSGSGHFHIQLPTLLEKDVSVDVYTWHLWTSLVLNGAVKAEFIDAIGKNGVAHVVDSIPVPHGKAGDHWEGEIEVEELKRVLKPYVEEDGEEDQEPGEL